jgi:hypothetical protein
MDIARLPDAIRYELMRFVPCMGVAPQTLRSYRYQKKTMGIVRALLDGSMLENVCRDIRKYDFLANPCFSYGEDGFHLVVYYRSLSLDEDYIAMYW